MILVIFFTIVAIISFAQFKSPSTNQVKHFIKQASQIIKGYQKIYRNILSTQVNQIDKPKEATYKAITIRYFTHDDLSNFVLNMVNEALNSYHAMDKTYQNKSAVRQTYFELDAIRIEVEKLKAKYNA